jgi:uncharacterized protein (TIGR00255 family)
MVNSMTGFGEAQGEINGVVYAVEIKTLNNRYLKTIIKLPESAGFLEENIEKLLRQNASRGTVNYTLRLKTICPEALLKIDEAALRSCIEQLEKTASAVSDRWTIDVSRLLDYPGILQTMPADEAQSKKLKKHVLNISRQAVKNLAQMRAAEGAALAADLQNNCKLIKKNLERIQGLSENVLRHYQQRLKIRVDALLADASLQLDAETLARELALFADRSDISEELARLDSHLDQFLKTVKSNGQAGRKLEFIGQEMLREANTIASKSLDSDIARIVVDVKCLIDRLKEQAANVE